MVRIFTDSANCISLKRAEGLPLTILPLRIIYKEKEYFELTEITIQEYHKILRVATMDEYPATSMVTPDMFFKEFRKAIDEGVTHAIVACITSNASGSLNSARIARDALLESGETRMRFTLIDSRGYSMMYGEPILQAAQMIKDGMSGDDAVTFMRSAFTRHECLFGCYTLKGLRKSGRISGMSAFVGEALGYKPVLHAIDGHIGPIDKARGEKALLPCVFKHLREHLKNPSEQVIALMYGDMPEEEINRVERMLREEFNPKDVLKDYLGCSVCTNVGPDIIAIFYEGAQRDPAPIWE